MIPQITISLEYYDKLCEDSVAFQRLKKGETYIHFYSSYTLGGRYTEVTSNDERFKSIHKEVEEIRAALSISRDQRRKAVEELEAIRKQGFFKRLFS